MPPRGAWASEVPAPSPRHPRVIPAPFPFKLDFLPAEELFFVFCRPGGLKRICLPPSAHVSGRLRGPFWGQFWPQKCSFVVIVLVPSVILLGVFFTQCWLRVSSEIRLLRALREKGAYGLRPTKTNGFSRFLHVRGAAGHAARKATEGNK